MGWLKRFFHRTHSGEIITVWQIKHWGDRWAEEEGASSGTEVQKNKINQINNLVMRSLDGLFTD